MNMGLSLSLASLAAKGGEVSDPAIVYVSGFTSDESSNFYTLGGGGPPYPDIHHATDLATDEYPALSGDLGADTAGVLWWGESVNTNSSLNRDFTDGILASTEYQLYGLIGSPNDIDGQTFTGANATIDVTLHFKNSGGSTISTTQFQNVQTDNTLNETFTTPANTAEIRVQIARKGTSSVPGALYYLYLRNVTLGGAIPNIVDPLRLPWPWAFKAATGESMTLDYSSAFGEGVSRIGVLSSASRVGATASGMTLRLSPTEDFADTPEPVVIAGYTPAGLQTLSSITLNVFSETAASMTTWDDDWDGIPTVYIEAGQDIVVDPQTFVSGGAWPRSVTFTSLPSWMTDAGNGVVYGNASGSVGADTSIVATVTDALGDSITVTVPVEIVAYDRTSPTALASSGGNIMTQIDPDDGGTGPEVYQLADGETYSMGALYGLNRNGDAPIIIMGPATGKAYINPFTLDNCNGVWIEGNIGLHRTTLPSGDLQNSLTDRTDRDYDFKGILQGNFGTQGSPKCWNRVTGVTCQGYETDLSNETGFVLIDDGGQITHSPGNDGTQLPTTGPGSRTCYRGGIEIGNMCIVSDVTFTSCAHPIFAVGNSSGAHSCRASRTRVDVVRLQTPRGFVIQDLRSGHDDSDPRLNCRGSEHQDGIQSGDPGGGAGERIVIVDSMVVETDWGGTQAIQLNMGEGGSFGADLDPERCAYDWIWRRFVGTSSAVNGFNGQGCMGTIEDSMIVADPETHGVVTASYGSTRRDKATRIDLDGNVLSSLTADTSNSAWDIGTNLILAGDDATDLGATTLADIFPNIASPATYNDPREAVDNGAAANTARFYRDNSSGYTQGPSWLNTGT